MSSTIRNNTYLSTGEGNRFYPSNPSSAIYDIKDIANALSKECRYNGHCNGFYSVAQHSVLCSYLVDQEFRLCALMHDATEAYVKDIPKPLKDWMGCDYKHLEQSVWEEIAKTFDLPKILPKEVDYADHQMMRFEVERGIAPDHDKKAVWGWVYDYDKPVFTFPFRLWTHEEARWKFLERYKSLTLWQ